MQETEKVLLKENYYTTHRVMVKDIIKGFNDFFLKLIEKIPESEIDYILEERFSKKQWKYINKIVEESE